MRVHDIAEKAAPTVRTPPQGPLLTQYRDTSWLVLSIVLSLFLLGAAGLHVMEMIRYRNFAWGNTWVLLYDVGLPVSLIALLVAGATKDGRSGRRALGCTTTAPGLSPGTLPCGVPGSLGYLTRKL